MPESGSSGTNTVRHVVVLGAGPAGLSAAWKLVDAGFRVTVLEAESCVGGMAATQVFQSQQGEFRFDYGGHRFLTKNPELLSFVESLLGDDLLHAERSSVIRYRGRTYEYPLDLSNLLKNAPWPLLLGAGRDLAWRMIRPPRQTVPDDQMSFADWITARFGPTLYQHFFEGYTGKLWGIDPQHLSGDWAAQRISLIDLRDVARRLLPKRGATPRTYARHYRYPKLGFGVIFDRLAEYITQRGGEILLNAPVTGLIAEGKQVRAVQIEQDGRSSTLEADAVISSIPLPHLVRMLGGSSRLGFRALRFFNMPLTGSDLSRHTWQYLSDPEIMATRLQEPRRRSPYMTPKDYTSVMLEIPCQEGDGTWHATQKTLHQRAWQDLSRLGIDASRDTGENFAAYSPHAYPLMTMGYEKERQSNLNFLDTFRNLHICGRQGTFRYIFTDTAMEMGMLAAKSVIEQQDLRYEIYNHRNEKTVIEVQSVA